MAGRLFEIAVPAPIHPASKLFSYKVPADLDCSIGSWVEVPFGKRKVIGLVMGEISMDNSETPPEKLKSIVRNLLPDLCMDPSRMDLIRWMSRHYHYPIGMVAENFLPTPVRKASEKILKKSLSGILLPEDSPPRPSPHQLTAEQAAALERIESNPKKTHLLWGVTGSGKTEIYLQAIERIILSGKSALVLVPEISLTPQLMSRFDERFPGQVAAYHSALKPTEQRKAWIECITGSKRILVGARSSVFLALPNLGIIIMDEEHDSSFKQEESLRYHTREVAQNLATSLGIPLVLGSATPSAESLALLQDERAILSLLNKRAAADAEHSEVSIIDLRKSLGEENKDPAPRPEQSFMAPEASGDFFLSQPLRQALDEVLARKEQAILFLNRRGFGSQLLCVDCGHTFDCPNCAVKITPHRHKLLCHYCGFEIPVPKICPSCMTPDRLKEVGIGTEKIEEALSVHHPKARVLRLDRDTVANLEDLKLRLQSFRDGEGDILLGTQMVSKGLDFPRVTLVGVVLADLGLSIPDFRADERALQLMLQVAGRSGRASLKGKTLIQTFQPEHAIFHALRAPDPMTIYREFMATELEKRDLLQYPPFGRICCLHFDSSDESSGHRAAEQVAAALRKNPNSEVQVLGPIASPLFKLRNRFRYQIMLKSRNEKHLDILLDWINSRWHEKKLEAQMRTRMVIDVNPGSML